MLALAVLAPALAQPSDAAPPAAASSDASHQVLVMLRMRPDHFDGGSSYGGGYGDSAGLAARRRTAERLAHEHGMTVVAEWPMPVLGVDCYVMSAPPGESVEALAAILSHDPAVAWSEPMHVYRSAGRIADPNDPLFKAQPAAKAWRLSDLHQIATGRKVRVAVVDSRIDDRHPDLAGQVEVNRDFVTGKPGGPEDHGTEVAGVIAAVADNHQGIVGVAPSARLLGLRACWQETGAVGTLCDTLSLARALNFAIETRAQVINLSLSGPQDLLLDRFLDIAIARGTVVVGAFDPTAAKGGFPASHAGVIAVANDDRAAPAPGVYLAPGRDVPTALPNGRWSLVEGSSFATAHVSGLAALALERASHAPDSATLIVARRGGGIDACATLLRAAPCRDCACQHPPSGSLN